MHAAPLPRRARRREGAPEAAAARRPAVGRDRAGALPALEPHRRRAVRHPPRARGLGGADVHRRVPPVERRRADTEQPDEWRIDLDPMPDCRLRARSAGWPTSRTRCSTSWAPSASRRPPAARACTSTSGSRRRRGFADVRRAALAFAREVERRAPDDVTTTWWRKDRDPRGAVRRLQPERPRPHDRQRLLGARQRRGHGVHPDPLGRGRRRRPARLHHRHRARPLRRARRPARRHRRRRCSTSRRCWSGPTATSARAPSPPGARGELRHQWPRAAAAEAISHATVIGRRARQPRRTTSSTWPPSRAGGESSTSNASPTAAARPRADTGSRPGARPGAGRRGRGCAWPGATRPSARRRPRAAPGPRPAARRRRPPAATCSGRCRTGSRRPRRRPARGARAARCSRQNAASSTGSPAGPSGRRAHASTRYGGTRSSGRSAPCTADTTTSREPARRLAPGPSEAWSSAS